MAAVAMVTCCALSALISAGVLATIGGALRDPLILGIAALLFVGAIAFALRPRRRGKRRRSDVPSDLEH